ncbi:hypothetical protein JHK85_038120 [Glycine max]|uniref:Uncharacterized protein n=1 Tax=Glycine max TaxID=3847 RepID=A0A0R0H729_SOYBN|nr:hypothetical protein JHK85_038120 [Glycine max]KAH1103517.1 hypothetical protein GYH30_037458 [Glycine max]
MKILLIVTPAHVLFMSLQAIVLYLTPQLLDQEILSWYINSSVILFLLSQWQSTCLCLYSQYRSKRSIDN